MNKQGDTKPFVDFLRAESMFLLPLFVQTAVPLARSSINNVRLAPSDGYRAAGMRCYRFHKPITKPLCGSLKVSS